MTFPPITPQNFDIHRDAIDGPRYDWTDREVSNLDVRENRPWVREHVTRRVHVEPKRSRTVVSVADEQYQRRDSRYKALWLGFWVSAGLVAFVVGYLVVNGVPA